MTDDEFTNTTRVVALTLVETMALLKTDPADAAAVVGASMLEALAALMGGAPAAIERLRSIADIAEAQYLASNPQPAHQWH